MYIREDLAYKLICYSNLGVINADQIKKNLGISNNQSIRRERKIIAKKKQTNCCKKYGKTV